MLLLKLRNTLSIFKALSICTLSAACLSTYAQPVLVRGTTMHTEYTEQWDQLDFLTDTMVVPLVSTQASPIEKIQLSETSYAAFRKPPGKGPFPTIMVIHGGARRYDMDELNDFAKGEPRLVFGLLLAKGYALAHATRSWENQNRDTLEMAMALNARDDVSDLVAFGFSAGGPPGLSLAETGNINALAIGEPATFFYMGPDNKGMRTKELEESVKKTGDKTWYHALMARALDEGPMKFYTADIREATRRKLERISCPVLMLHGDLISLVPINFGIFLPEMIALGKRVEANVYPGNTHSFYLGINPRTPETPFLVANDLDNFFSKNIGIQPQPVAAQYLELESIHLSYPHPEAKHRRKANLTKLESEIAAADTNKDGKLSEAEFDVMKHKLGG